jgi:DedD protein
MARGAERRADEKGLSARYLVLIFLMGVAACAVFFSLGFLVGYNERPSRTAGAAEQVTPSGVIPPTVNPPLETVQPSGKEKVSPPATAPEVAAAGAGKAAKPPAAPAAESGAQGEPSSVAKSGGTPASASALPQVPPGVEVGTAFTVQVAASRNREDAEKLVKQLTSRGYAVFVVTPEFASASDNLFRVQVGPFATREEAEKVRAKIAKEGFKPFVRH